MRKNNSANDNVNNDVECPEYDLSVFMMLETDDKELTKNERDRLLAHMQNCQPCSNCWQELQSIAAGRSLPPTRRQQLDFLALLETKAWSLEFSFAVARSKEIPCATSIIYEEINLSLELQRIAEATKRAEDELA